MSIYRETAWKVLEEANRVILGKEEITKEIMAALLAGGHVLLEDIPGVGKTTLALAFSKMMGMDWKRVQFTPDVLPRILPDSPCIARMCRNLSISRERYSAIFSWQTRLTGLRRRRSLLFWR